MAKTADLFVVQVDKHREGEPNVVFILVPQVLSNDFGILQKKLEASPINSKEFLPKWGRLNRVLHIQGLEKVQLFSDDIQPITFADWANMIVNQLGEHMEEEEDTHSSAIEDQLVYFMGEYTLLRDGSI